MTVAHLRAFVFQRPAIFIDSVKPEWPLRVADCHRYPIKPNSRNPIVANVAAVTAYGSCVLT